MSGRPASPTVTVFVTVDARGNAEAEKQGCREKTLLNAKIWMPPDVLPTTFGRLNTERGESCDFAAGDLPATCRPATVRPLTINGSACLHGDVDVLVWRLVSVGDFDVDWGWIVRNAARALLT